MCSSQAAIQTIRLMINFTATLQLALNFTRRIGWSVVQVSAQSRRYYHNVGLIPERPPSHFVKRIAGKRVLNDKFSLLIRFRPVYLISIILLKWKNWHNYHFKSRVACISSADSLWRLPRRASLLEFRSAMDYLAMQRFLMAAESIEWHSMIHIAALSGLCDWHPLNGTADEWAAYLIDRLKDAVRRCVEIQMTMLNERNRALFRWAPFSGLIRLNSEK